MKGCKLIFANGEYVGGKSGNGLSRSSTLERTGRIKPRGKRAKANACPDDQWSKQVKARAAGRCEVCGCKGQHAHHIRTKKTWPQYRHDLRNGIFVCLDHHEEAHGNMRKFQAWCEETRPDYAELCAEARG